jgi:hypothetical protein
MIYAFGGRSQPQAIASVTRGPHWADVIVLRGPDRAAAYRTLVRAEDDPMMAEWVVWHYLGEGILPSALPCTSHPTCSLNARIPSPHSAAYPTPRTDP